MSRLLGYLLLLTLSSVSSAETIQIKVTKKRGKAIQDAVVYVASKDIQRTDKMANFSIDQVDKQFANYVTVVQVGSKIQFPNHDKIKHHVYSFSQAKTFEIPLYKGTPSKPIHLDKVGEVSLGCNIHDWMQGYIFVTPTPYFGLTDKQGLAQLQLPPGQYEIAIWHPDIKKKYAKKRYKIDSTKQENMSVKIALKFRFNSKKSKPVEYDELEY